MWIIVPFAILMLGDLATLDAQPYYDSQGYLGNPTYNTWSAPRESNDHGLLQMVSSLCPNCFRSGGIDELTGVPGLKNAIEYSYYHTIKPSVEEMFDNYGVDRMAAYRYADSICNRNAETIAFLPAGDVVNMLCSDMHETVQEEDM